MRSMTTLRMALVLLAALLVAPGIAAAGDGSWLHVHVTEDDGRDGVRINVPLSIAEFALGFIDDAEFNVGDIDINGRTYDVSDLRHMWSELKGAGDVPLLSVDEEDEQVDIGIVDGFLRLLVTSSNEAEKVRISLPSQVVDALFSGKENQLNVSAAISELKNHDLGELISVRDGQSRVRIWVD